MSVRKPMSKKLRFEVFKRDGFACQYCGAKAPDVRLHVDHVIPVSKGGDDDMANLTTSCADCNHGKAANFHDPLLKRINDLEIEVEEKRSLVTKLRDAIGYFKEVGLGETEQLLNDFGLCKEATESDFNNLHLLVWRVGYSNAADAFAVAAYDLGPEAEPRVLIETTINYLALRVKEDTECFAEVLA